MSTYPYAVAADTSTGNADQLPQTATRINDDDNPNKTCAPTFDRRKCPKSIYDLVNALAFIFRPIKMQIPYLPTTLHLQNEIALWTCTILFTAASSHTLYRDSYLTTSGDYKFLFWVSMWLGRHWILRLLCTWTWVDIGRTTLGGLFGVSNHEWKRKQYGSVINHCDGGRERLRSFKKWTYQFHYRRTTQQGNVFRAMYYRIRWLLTYLSPNSIYSAVMYVIQSWAMAGQYCDNSAFQGLAPGVIFLGGGAGGFGGFVGGGDLDLHHHHSSKGSNKNVHSSLGGANSLFGSNPASNETHAIVILSLSKIWGSLCGLSYAFWALFMRGEKVSSGSSGNSTGGSRSGTASGTGLKSDIQIWFLSLFASIGLASPISDTELIGSFGGSNIAGNRKIRRKNSSALNQVHSHLSHIDSSSQLTPDITSNTLLDSSGNKLDLLSGKCSFRIFPNQIRSHALHVQQMRTSQMYRILEKVWESSPPMQLVVAAGTGFFLFWGWTAKMGGYRWLLANSIGVNGLDYMTVESNIPHFGQNPNTQNSDSENRNLHYWANQTPFPAPPVFDVEPPSLSCLALLIVTFGTAASLVFFGRMILPIPEFVAGTNVLKAIRAETKILGSGGVALGGGGSANKWSKQKDKELPWSEQFRSITTENRLRLYYKVAAIRIMENILLCAILPQSEIVCRFTEHCESGPVLWGPSGVVGITGRRYGKGTSFLTSSYDTLAKDDFVTRVIIISVMITTVLLLASQMTIMNRTYLAIMGYISGEWALVTEERDDDSRRDPGVERSESKSCLKFWWHEFIGFGAKSNNVTPVRRSSNATLMQWDPKRRYQKGDRIAYEDAVYEAISNSPEGPPFDPFLRAAHDVFRDELGHPDTSHVLACLSIASAFMATVLVTLVLFWKNAGWNFIPLLLCCASTLVGGYAVTHAGKKDTDCLAKISEEIAKAFE
eukprot:CAMPEP_0171336950 /NCGR_PEP_ID=MMETSP0878-20121228/6380_1 /TAXON_ID=67004 /ORGANISM="Thalassiosira weissflogii, Strain CCMP1336" /LENGTH=941 /DNA_ID=CAMNT_0011838517 /DNA_START=32 /DNA_END=2857 /DNA_ORIENTATION=-